MNCEEIRKYIDVGTEKSVCVEISLLNRYPGLVRMTKISAPARVSIEINTFGYDEGGLIIELGYNDLNSLISAVEDFLGQKIADWENFTKSGAYPEEPTQPINFDQSGALLKMDLVNQKIDLPQGWVKREILPGYWCDVAKGAQK